MDGFLRLVARALSIEEAHRIAERYDAEGYKTKIVENKQGNLAMFEVWVGKEPDVFTTKGRQIKAD